MSVWYDAIDWLGGLPYEYASSERVTAFAAERGFQLMHLVRTRRLGCNEFVFARRSNAEAREEAGRQASDAGPSW